MSLMIIRAWPAALVGLVLFASCDGDITDGATDGGSVGSVRPTPTVRPTMTCDEIDVCEGDAVNASSGCVECAVLGNGTLAVNGGACLDEYTACFGPSGSCEEGGHPDCCAFFNCLLACPDDDPGTAKNEFLDCACTNDGSECSAEQDNDTCLGAEPVGGQRYLAWAQCLYVDVCGSSCS